MRPGETILLADGRIRLEVTEAHPPEQIVCRSARSAVNLSSGKGVNLPQTQLNISALTEKDLADVDWICRTRFRLRGPLVCAA